MKILKIILIGLVITGVIGGIVWWFIVRPARIRNHCNWVAWSQLKEKQYIGIQIGATFYETTYNACIRNKGLKSEKLN